MSSKTNLIASINTTNSSLTSVNAKLDNLRAARTKVKAVSLTVDYKISDGYHLEGDAYDNLEAEEKEILSNLKRDMHTKRSNVLDELDTAITNAQSSADSLSSSLAVLQLALANATD